MPIQAADRTGFALLLSQPAANVTIACDTAVETEAAQCQEFVAAQTPKAPTIDQLRASDWRIEEAITAH